MARICYIQYKESEILLQIWSWILFVYQIITIPPTNSSYLEPS